MTYDDERVVALLKESVPAVPDVPARVDAVRRLAKRQRSFAQVQALGAAASVVLVLAGVTAFVRPGGTSVVGPTKDPVRAMTAAFEDRKSARIEMTMKIAGSTYRMTGVFDVDGSGEMRGNLSGDGSETVIRIVDGVTYRTARRGETLPPGKKWVRQPVGELVTPSDLVDLTRNLKGTLRDVTFLRSTEVRGVPVAEYTVNRGEPFDVQGTAIRMTFAIDDDGLPRRMTTTIEDGGPTTVTADFYDYGVRVDVTAPPASEVVDEIDVLDPPAGPGAPTVLWACAQGAPTKDHLDACARAYERSVKGGVTCTTTYVSPEEWSYRCTDGVARSEKP